MTCEGGYQLGLGDCAVLKEKGEKFPRRKVLTEGRGRLGVPTTKKTRKPVFGTIPVHSLREVDIGESGKRWKIKKCVVMGKRKIRVWRANGDDVAC